ncbi:c-type cytochrome [Paracrocinitomix mangrovi]|uniref:c-type cytochrome n=1 Tax=Paracrocinitomix mangrovi TaxID=2862509 RepID=UPI001C8DDEA1|nr:c-type cytochrome [Paracrocinitomix mangrovi]UKN02264.1 c-type cytochrome [Paracrocinitomix mangrovi]
MKKRVNTIMVLFNLFAIFLLVNCGDKSEEAFEDESKENVSKERGEYLVNIIGCADCHTPKKMTEKGPVPDMDRWLMGYPEDAELPQLDKSNVLPGGWTLFNGDLTAAVGPWGISFSANLTPDGTGLGNWTFEQFKKAMTKGKFKGIDGSRPLLPPMPWQNYRQLSDSDLQAIFNYLMSIKPIQNIVPQYIPFENIK